MKLIFSISGEVRLRQSLDYETSKEHSVIVVATDGGKPPLSSSVQLQVRVIDVNDNEPVFEKRHYTVRTPENAAIQSRLIRVLATDLDSDKNGLIGYRIEPAHKLFQISNDQREPGWIVLADALDYEKSTRHEFQVMAYDHGQPAKSSVAVVTVDVVDVNDNQPRILNCNRTLVVKASLYLNFWDYECQSLFSRLIYRSPRHCSRFKLPTQMGLRTVNHSITQSFIR